MLGQIRIFVALVISFKLKYVMSQVIVKEKESGYFEVFQHSLFLLYSQ